MSNIATIEAALKTLASKYKTRKAFNRAVQKQFPFINEGAFRLACDAGDYVIKLRRDKPYYGSDFSIEDIRESNEVEAQNYESLMEQAPAVAFFVLAPVYIVLQIGRAHV